MADNVEIQGLEFQIQENSAGAVAGLENLKKGSERVEICDRQQRQGA